MSEDITPNQTFDDIGLDNYGQNNLDFSGAEENKKAQTMMEFGVPSNFLQDGELISLLRVSGTIYVNDGVNDRVLIGKGVGLF